MSADRQLTVHLWDSATMPLRDVQQSLQLELEEGEQGKTVVVKSVAAGSRAQQVRLTDLRACSFRCLW